MEGTQSLEPILYIPNMNKTLNCIVNTLSHCLLNILRGVSKIIDLCKCLDRSIEGFNGSGSVYEPYKLGLDGSFVFI